MKAETEALPPVFDYLENILADGREYLVGDSLTLADITVASPFRNFEYGRADIDWDAYSNIRVFIDRMFARDSYAALFAMDAQILKGA